MTKPTAPYDLEAAKAQVAAIRARADAATPGLARRPPMPNDPHAADFRLARGALKMREMPEAVIRRARGGDDPNADRALAEEALRFAQTTANAYAERVARALLAALDREKDLLEREARVREWRNDWIGDEPADQQESDFLAALDGEATP